MSASVAASAGSGFSSRSRSTSPHALSPRRNSNGWQFCQPIAICRTKCRSSRRMATGTSTRRTTAGSTSSISMRNRAISPKRVLFRRLLEGEHLVAWVEVHDLAVLDHPGEMLAALQNGDVGDRVLVHDDDVGELARRELTQLAFETDCVGIVAGGGDDGLERRV